MIAEPAALAMDEAELRALEPALAPALDAEADTMLTPLARLTLEETPRLAVAA